MDRLEVNRELGVIRVLDYKFTLKEKAAEEMRTHYQLQLELYAWAAIQLCGSEFSLKKLEAKLIHLSQGAVSVVDVPINLTSLQERAMKLLNEARETLGKERAGDQNSATRGDYCRYCEFQKKCPEFS